MRKLLYDDVRSIIESKGCKLISTKYNGSKKKLEIQCHCGNLFHRSFEVFKRSPECLVCAKQTLADKVKHSYDYIKDEFRKKNITLLSKEYKNSKVKMKVMCSRGHVYYTTWCNARQGHGCPKCYGNKRLTIKDAIEFTDSINYKLISTEYINSQEKLWFECDKGHKFQMRLNSLKNGQRCPVENRKDKHLYEYVKGMVESVDGYKLLSTKYNRVHDKLTIECDKGHIYNVTYGNFSQGYRCPVCYHESMRRYFTEEELLKFKSYKDNVYQLSNQIYRKYYYQINPKNLKRSMYNYHLDHIYTVIDGFKNNVPPEIMSNKNNLQMLWCTDNISKNYRSEITKQLLYHLAM